MTRPVHDPPDDVGMAGQAQPGEPDRRRRSARGPLLKRIIESLGKSPEVPDPPRDAGRAIAACDAVMSARGEVSWTRLAGQALAAYQSLDAETRELFFDLLVDEFSPDARAVNRAADAYRMEPSPTTLGALQAAVESPRQELFRRFNIVSGGIGVLVDMRRQLLRTLDAHPHRTGVAVDLLHLFKSWFNRGFLVLERIDWRSPGLVLERLIQYEAVHEIQGWRDLRRRLEADRRCYAFMHPALPDEPLIFIEVALSRGMSDAIQPLLDPDSAVEDPAGARCAIFYSITNCQPGLRGVSFGNFLIKQVVENLRRDFPRLKTFATLSPVPGFRRWLETADTSPVRARGTEFLRMLSSVTPETLAGDKHLRELLTRWCAFYLLHARQGDFPLDPVMRFHLANGARLERLNWLGDASDTGMRRSFGVTVNYVYRLAQLEHNHEAYARDHAVGAARDLERLARLGRP